MAKSRVPARPVKTEKPIKTEVVASTSTDPLKRYLADIQRYPLLTPEEEESLVERVRAHNDNDAFKRLVQANLRLVAKIAFEYRSIYLNVLDLIQEGNVGLMRAVIKFDPTKGARLGYYSSWWIRSYILKYILDNFRLVKIGTTQAQKKLFYHLIREQERLQAQGLQPGPKLLADRLHVREKDVIEMSERLSGSGAEASLDAPMSDDGVKTHLSAMADPTEGADSRIERDELLQKLSARLPEFRKQLGPRELQVLDERLLSEEPKTLQEVADNYGLTRERVRQIEASVLTKLRKFLRPSFGKIETS